MASGTRRPGRDLVNLAAPSTMATISGGIKPAV